MTALKRCLCSACFNISIHISNISKYVKISNILSAALGFSSIGKLSELGKSGFSLGSDTQTHYPKTTHLKKDFLISNKQDCLISILRNEGKGLRNNELLYGF